MLTQRPSDLRPYPVQTGWFSEEPGDLLNIQDDFTGNIAYI